MSSLRLVVGQGTIGALFTASLLLANACSGDGGEVEFDPIGGNTGNGAATSGGTKPSTAGASTGGAPSLAGSSAGGASNRAGATSNGGAEAGTASGGTGSSAGSETGGTDAGGEAGTGTNGGMAGASGSEMGGAGMGGGGSDAGGGGTASGGMAGAGGKGGAGGSGGAPSCTPKTEVCDGLDNDCDKAADEDQTCALGCTGAAYEGHSYVFCSIALGSATLAATTCQSMGLGMVMIQSQAENTFVTGQLKGSSWLGASDQAQEERWVWYATGEVFWNDGDVDGKYENWLSQPKHDDDENCAVILGSAVNKGEWSDLSCTSPGYRAACESTDPIP
jgi:hypothetical protein